MTPCCVLCVHSVAHATAFVKKFLRMLLSCYITEWREVLMTALRYEAGEGQGRLRLSGTGSYQGCVSAMLASAGVLARAGA